MNKKNQRRSLRTILVWALFCLALSCGAISATAASGKPGKAKIISTQSKKGGKIQIKYKRVSGADGYQIVLATNRKFTSDKITVTVTKGKTTSKTIKNLDLDEQYFVRMRAYRKSGKKKAYGKWSVVVAVGRKLDASEILGVRRYATGFDLIWRKVSGAQGYQVQYARTPGFMEAELKSTVGQGTQTSLLALQRGAVYYVRVRAWQTENSVKEYGEWSKAKMVELSSSLAPADSGGDGKTPGQAAAGDGTKPSLPPEVEKPDDYYEGDPEDKEATVWGFQVFSSTADLLHKVNKSGNGASRTEDGNHIYTARFLCDGGENWLKSLEFEAEDVTPNAYRRMYAAMNVQGGVISQSGTTGTSWSDFGYVPRVMEPLDDSKETAPVEMKYAESFMKLTITARMATRVIKLTAKKDGKVLDTIYLTASGDSSQSEKQYVSQDEQLYTAVRHKVEAALWKPGMTNLEKLRALQEYINTTTHYPDEDITKQKYNPTFWQDWSVDGIDLYDNMAGDTMLNKTMALQGGTTTCQASSILLKAATEDLGLPGVANKETAGEGVWTGFGTASSNPGNPFHETFYYQDPEGKVYSLDAQGMMYSRKSGMITCEEHQCREKLVPLY